MIELPKLTGREFRPFDWYGWIMSFITMGLLYFSITTTHFEWWAKVFYGVLFVMLGAEYIARVAFGRVYKHVYYDTIIHDLYELKVGEDKYFVCSDGEDELKLYMDVHYPGITYTVIDKYPLESFYKKELFQ